jgi:hypothetical protein
MELRVIVPRGGECQYVRPGIVGTTGKHVVDRLAVLPSDHLLAPVTAT